MTFGDFLFTIFIGLPILGLIFFGILFATLGLVMLLINSKPLRLSLVKLLKYSLIVLLIASSLVGLYQYSWGVAVFILLIFLLGYLTNRSKLSSGQSRT